MMNSLEIRSSLVLLTSLEVRRTMLCVVAGGRNGPGTSNNRKTGNPLR